jgi:hypothetical protein
MGRRRRRGHRERRRPEAPRGPRQFAAAEQLANVTVVKDDLFASLLEPQSFDLVHARFQLAPLGRASDQLAAYHRLVRPGGTIVLEDPDASTWHFNPPAESAERLITLILGAFESAGGDFNAGRQLPQMLRELGVEPMLEAHVLALPPRHPYLRLPLQFANALEPRRQAVSAERLMMVAARWLGSGAVAGGRHPCCDTVRGGVDRAVQRRVVVLGEQL